MDITTEEKQKLVILLDEVTEQDTALDNRLELLWAKVTELGYNPNEKPSGRWLSKRNLLDLADRSIATFIQAGFAIYLAGAASGWELVKTSLIAGGLAVGKFLWGKSSEYLKANP